jgi:hypothetical protein
MKKPGTIPGFFVSVVTWLALIFDAFSSSEPVSTSLENAIA